MLLPARTKGLGNLACRLVLGETVIREAGPASGVEGDEGEKEWLLTLWVKPVLLPKVDGRAWKPCSSYKLSGGSWASLEHLGDK